MNTDFLSDAKLRRLANTTYKENTDAYLSRSDLTLDQIKRYVRTRSVFEGWARKRAAHAISLVTLLQGKLANLKRELHIHRRKMALHRRDKAARLAQLVLDGHDCTCGDCERASELAKEILAETSKVS